MLLFHYAAVMLDLFDRLPEGGVHVKDAGFDCEWTDTDDASLLRGVYKYGVGNWDAIRMDPELKLSEVRNLFCCLTLIHSGLADICLDALNHTLMSVEGRCSWQVNPSLCRLSRLCLFSLSLAYLLLS